MTKNIIEFKEENEKNSKMKNSERIKSGKSEGIKKQ